MTWDRQLPTGELDYRGKGEIAERYSVRGGPTVAQVIANPTSILTSTGDPLPGYGTAHPVIQGLILQRYRAASISRNGQVLEVMAVYGDPGRFRIPNPPNRADPNHRAFASGTRIIEVDLLYQRGYEKVSVLPNGQPFSNVEWREERLRTKVKIKRRIYQTTVVGWGEVEEDILREETDTLHLVRFSGAPLAWYLFSHGDVDEIEPGIFSVEYYWDFDPGNRMMRDSQGQIIPTGPYFVPPLTSYTMPPMEGGWIRPPWHEMLIVPDPSGNPGVPGDFIVVCNHEFHPQGWTRLPGVP